MTFRYPLIKDLPSGAVTLNPGPDLRYVAIGSGGDILGVESTRQQAVDDITRLDPGRIAIDDLQENLGPTENPSASATDPNRALQRAGLEPLNFRDVMSISLESAYRALVPYFSLLKREGGGTIRAYKDAGSMAEAFLGQNYKTAKSDPADDPKGLVMGLTLLPARRLTNYGELDSRGAVLTTVEDLLRKTAQGGGSLESIVPSHERLAPAKRIKQWTLCSGSSADCENSCLVYTGRNVADVYNHRRKAVGTLALLERPDAFCRMLIEAIRLHSRSEVCKDLKPYVRLNVLSDVPWELLIPGMFHHFEGGPVSFYDYTKVANRKPPPNYDLTFSYSGINEPLARAELARGHRCAVVFLAMKPKSGKSWKAFRYIGPAPKGGHRPQATLPPEFWGLPVRDGDRSDLRPQDPKKCIVGLRWKTPAGSQSDPTSSEFRFVTRAYHIGGEIFEQLEGPAESMLASSRRDQFDYLVVPVTPRYQPIDPDVD